jgi:hypothetical protein
MRKSDDGGERIIISNDSEPRTEQAVVPDEAKLPSKIEKMEKEGRKALRFYDRIKKPIIINVIEIIIVIPILLFSPHQNSYQTRMMLLPTIFVFVWVIISVILFILLFKSKTRSICVYLSINAAKSLETGNVVIGAYYSTRFLDFLKTFCGSKIKIVKDFPSIKIRTLFSDHIEQLYEKRLSIEKAILENPDTAASFSKQYYSLASSLIVPQRPNLDEANYAINLLLEYGEKYAQPRTFLQKHRQTQLVVKILSESLKVLAVPIFAVILWLMFGYK